MTAPAVTSTAPGAGLREALARTIEPGSFAAIEAASSPLAASRFEQRRSAAYRIADALLAGPLKPILDALAASRAAESAAIRERDEARAEATALYEDRAIECETASRYWREARRLTDALAATNARAERLAAHDPVAFLQAIQRNTSLPDQYRDAAAILMPGALSARAALAEPAAETQETGTREGEDVHP